MTTDELTTHVVDWAVSVLPELSGSYDHATDERYKGLPDIAVEIVSMRVTDIRGDGRMAKLQQIQQLRMKQYDLELILVVDPDPPEQAEAFVKDFADRLVDNLLSNKTLGGRVAWVNDTPRVSYRPPFVEFTDGTRGRIVTLYLQVGQQVEVG